MVESLPIRSTYSKARSKHLRNGKEGECKTAINTLNRLRNAGWLQAHEVRREWTVYTEKPSEAWCSCSKKPGLHGKRKSFRAKCGSTDWKSQHLWSLSHPRLVLQEILVLKEPSRIKRRCSYTPKQFQSSGCAEDISGKSKHNENLVRATQHLRSRLRKKASQLAVSSKVGSAASTPQGGSTSWRCLS